MVSATEFKMPYFNLKTLIAKKGFTQSKIAEMLGMPRTTFNLKINRTNGRDFTLQEAVNISVILEEKIESFY